MLIILDSSLIDKIDTDKGIQLVIGEIAHSRIRGKHIVYADRKTLKFLSQYLPLSEAQRGIYQHLYNKLSQSKAYLRHINTYVKILWEKDILSKQIEKNKTIISVSYNIFSDSSFDKTKILAENLHDVDIYAKIAQIHQHNYKLDKIPLEYLRQGGGGQETPNAFKSILNERSRFCICITDSDKQSPHHDYGSVSKKLSEIKNASESLCDWTALEVRAIENLFPISFYQDVFGSDVHKKRAIEFLHSIEASTMREARKFLQMKEGLKLFEVLESTGKGTEDMDQYWWQLIQEINISDKFTDCTDTQKCSNGSKKKCMCYIWSGFGDKILTQFLKYIISQSNEEIAKVIQEDLVLKDEWERIGQIILDWCCGSQTNSTI